MTENNIKESTQTRKIDWWVYSIPILCILALSFYFIVQSRPGKWGVALFYIAPILIAFLSIIFLIIGIIRSFRVRPFFTP